MAERRGEIAGAAQLILPLRKSRIKTISGILLEGRSIATSLRSATARNGARSRLVRFTPASSLQRRPR